MTRHTWRWILVAVLAGCLPACTHLRFRPFSSSGDQKSAAVDKAASKDSVRPDVERIGVQQTQPALAQAGDRQAILQLPHSPYHPVAAQVPGVPRFSLHGQVYPAPVLPENKILELSPQHPRPPDPPQTIEAKSPINVPRQPPSRTEPDEPLVAALACVLQKRGTDAVHYLKRYEPTTQEMFLRMMTLIADLNEKSLDKMSPEEVLHIQEQLQGLLLRVWTRSELAIDALCLCEEIRGYRSYKRVPPEHAFVPTSDNRPGERVLIYLEVRNLGSVKRESHYEARLSVTADLIDETGMKVWTRNLQTASEPLPSPTPNIDHLRYMFYLPKVPRPGKHRLTLTIRDETSSPPRVASRSVDLHIAADGMR